jgi:multiple sugar transport system permease protein
MINFKSKLHRRKRNTLRNIMICLVLLIVLFPFFFLIITSLRPPGEFLANPDILPKNFTLEHYRKVFSGGRGLTYLQNSLVVTTLVTIISISFGTMAGYALARSHFSPRLVMTIIFVFIFIRFYPRISIIVPWFLILNHFRMLDTVAAVVILHLGLTVPFVVWLMYTFFRGIPIELEESASIDGAGFFRKFRSIVLPLAMPGVATASIFTAFLSWNEFLLASSVTREAAKTLPVAIAGFVTDKGTDWGAMMAMSALLVVPMVTFALVLQKYLIKGMMLGAVK